MDITTKLKFEYHGPIMQWAHLFSYSVINVLKRYEVSSLSKIWADGGTETVPVCKTCHPQLHKK